jgi:hypothetical protein
LRLTGSSGFIFDSSEFFFVSVFFDPAVSFDPAMIDIGWYYLKCARWNLRCHMRDGSGTTCESSPARTRRSCLRWMEGWRGSRGVLCCAQRLVVLNSTCDLLDVCPGYEAREMVPWIVAVAWQEFLVVRVATTKLFWEPFRYQHMRYKHVTFAFDGAGGDQKFLTKHEQTSALSSNLRFFDV